MAEEEDLLEGLGGDDEPEPDRPSTDILEEEPPPAEEPAKEEPAKEEPASKPAEPTTEEVKAAPADSASAPAAEEKKEEEKEEDGGLDPASLDKLKSVQRKPVLKRLRFELSPFASVSVNDAFYTHLTVGGSAVFYPHDNFGFGASGMYFYANPKTKNHEVVRQNRTAVIGVFDSPLAIVGGDIYWNPIYGKVSLIDRSIIPFDFFVVGGMGVAFAGNNKRPSFNIGLGQRYLATEWLALRIEVRDYIYLDTQEANGIPRSDIQNLVMFQLGVSFFVPPWFEYSGL